MGRRHFTAAEKVKIVEEARQPGASVAEVCRRHGIASSVFYRWDAQMRKGAREALCETRGKRDRRDAELTRLREELQKKNRVIAELTEALIQEKKGLSDYLTGSDSRSR
jgi:transposase-like protein